MTKKIIKQNLRFYSKFLLLIGALIAFICSFGVSSYAWSTDSIGNLVSDNLIDASNREGRYWVTTQSDISATINDLDLGTYTISCDLTPISIDNGYDVDDCFFILQVVGGQYTGHSRDAQVNDFISLNETKRGFLTFTKENYTNYEFRLWGFGNHNGGNHGIGLISNIMLNTGTTALSYEPYGVTYYPYSRVRKEAYTNYGVYQFIDNIKIEYNTGSSIGTYNTYTTPIIPNPLTSPLSFSNGTLILSYDLLNDILEGSNNWYYVLTITFKNNRVKISDFNQWNISTIGNNLTFLSYSNTTYTKSNATGISYSVNLTDNGFNSSEYLKSITLNITGYTNNNMFTQIGSSNDSLSYMYGYNYGYEKGKDNGFDSGFTDGKNEGYSMGYNDGYRDGTNEEFTTNGFKTLIGSIFNYPINMIRSVFNFEFMGINIFSLIVFIMSIGIVIFVIRRFKK